MPKLSVSKAADQFVQAKREEKLVRARLDEASKVLKDYFHANPDKRDFRGIVGFAVSVRRVLDSEKVKAFLGKRLSEFERDSTVETLSPLK